MRIAIVLALLFSAACGDSNQTGPQDAGADAAPADASCFDNPQSHYEIINACTTAQRIYKDSHPPLLNDDGTVPSLP